jgi:peroxiredoxin (alkyl hydroperoxide reductase subunit C)
MSAPAVKVGQRVPGFSLMTYDPAANEFGRFSMAAQLEKRRWTILFFYTADFSYACAGEFEALSRKSDEFAALGCDVVTVSTDTHHAHLAWKRHDRSLADARHLMGADPSGEVSRLFGVYDEGSGLALRGTFIIQPDGMLLSGEVNFYNLARNIDELLRKFKAAEYTFRHPSEICAPDWRGEGDRTLRDPGTKQA